MAAKKNALAGVVTMTNTKQWPFNDSEQTIVLAGSKDDKNYTVRTELVSARGDVEEIVVYDKAINGFKIAFTGPASQVVIKYIVSETLK